MPSGKIRISFLRTKHKMYIFSLPTALPSPSEKPSIGPVVCPRPSGPIRRSAILRLACWSSVSIYISLLSCSSPEI